MILQNHLRYILKFVVKKQVSLHLKVYGVTQTHTPILLYRISFLFIRKEDYSIYRERLYVKRDIYIYSVMYYLNFVIKTYCKAYIGICFTITMRRKNKKVSNFFCFLKKIIYFCNKITET